MGPDGKPGFANRRIFSLLSFLLTSGVIALTFHNARTAQQVYETEMREAFRVHAQAQTEAIQEELEIYYSLLRGVAALYSVNPSLTPDEFSQYLEGFEAGQQLAGRRAVALAVNYDGSEEALEEIRRRVGDPELVPHPDEEEGERPMVIFVYPSHESNAATLGFEPLSDLSRRDAFEAARDSGEIAVSGAVQLIEGARAKDRHGFVVVLPLYRDPSPDTVEARRESLVGFVYCAVRAKEFFSSAAPQNPQSLLRYRVFEDPFTRRTLFVGEAFDDLAVAREREARTLQIAQRTWTIEFEARPPFDDRFAENPAIDSYVNGGALALLMGGSLIAVGMSLHRASTQREWLRATLSSIADGVIATDSAGQVMFCNPTAERLTGKSWSEIEGTPITDLLPLGAHDPSDGSNPIIELTGEDRSQKVVAVAVTNLAEGEGGHQGSVFALTDLTESERARKREELIHDIVRIVAKSSSLKDTAERIIELLCHWDSWDVGSLWASSRESGDLHCVATWHRYTWNSSRFLMVTNEMTLPPGEDLPGAVLHDMQPRWCPTLAREERFVRRAAAVESGLQSGLAFPVMSSARCIGVFELFSVIEKPENLDTLSFLSSVGLQAGQYLEQKRIEEEIAASEARKSAILESAMDAIVIADDHGRITEWNPAAEKLFEYTREEAIGGYLHDLIIPPRLREQHLAGMSHYRNTGEAKVLDRRLELPAVRRGGGEFPVELAIVRVPLEGAPVFTAYIRDLTDVRKMREALVESESRFRTMADSAPVMIWLKDPERGKLWINRMFRRFRGENVNVKGDWIDEIHPDERERYRAEFNDALQSRAPFQSEYRLKRADGRFRWLLENAVPLYDGGTTFRGFVGTSLDITERKLMEEERTHILATERAARTELEQANRLKDEFLATLSHELRTPLNAILGWTQILQRRTLSPEMMSDGLSAIENNARTQSQIIEDLIEMNRISSGKVRLEVVGVPLEVIIRTAVEAVAPAAEAKEISIESHLTSESGVVNLDPSRFQQIASHLLSNAVKFTPPRGKVSLTAIERRGEFEFVVSDDGEGIAAEFLPHVFERFRQADLSDSRRHGGVGLGLAIAKHLVELHGGTITAESAGTGRGATFRVRIPQGVPTAPVSGLSSLTAPVRDTAPGWFADLHGVKVLALDDELEVRELLSMILVECGAEVKVASSLKEGIAILKSFVPDVILSDLDSQSDDGYLFVKKVRAKRDPHFKRVPVIACLSHGEVDEERLVKAGFQRSVAKPIEPSVLTNTIVELVGSRK